MKDTTRRQSFKAFLASTGDSMVKTIATEYATENDTVTLEKIAEKYNLTGYAMRQLIDYAISHCIVSFQIAVFIREKAHRNQSRHSNVESHFTKSDLYYDEIFNTRSEIIKHKISDSVIRNVVDLYIHSTNMSAYTIAHSVGFNVYELNLIIEKAIIFSIIDDSTVEELFYSPLSKMSSESRKARTRRKLEHLRERIMNA